MSFIAIAGTALAIGAGVTAAGGVAKAVDGGIKANKAKKAAEKAQIELDKQKQSFANLDTSNPYLNMENTMEDLTVNTKQAEFEAQQNAQNQANIMDNMRGAAGGSGIAALAQTLANQGALQTQKASASIGMQEAKNQQLQAGAQSKIDLMTAQQDNKNAALTAKGFADVDKLRGEGAYRSQQAEAGKQSTLLGMEAGQLQSAKQAAAQNDAMLIGGVGDVLGGLAGGFDAKGKFGLKNMFKRINTD